MGVFLNVCRCLAHQVSRPTACILGGSCHRGNLITGRLNHLSKLLNLTGIFLKQAVVGATPALLDFRGKLFPHAVELAHKPTQRVFGLGDPFSLGFVDFLPRIEEVGGDTLAKSFQLRRPPVEFCPMSLEGRIDNLLHIKAAGGGGYLIRPTSPVLKSPQQILVGVLINLTNHITFKLLQRAHREGQDHCHGEGNQRRVKRCPQATGDVLEARLQRFHVAGGAQRVGKATHR